MPETPSMRDAALAMLAFFEKQQAWSYETFGPPSFKGPRGPLDHLKKEAQEAYDEADPERQREEIVDCLFLVYDAAHRAGMSYLDLVRGAFAKLEKNQGRTWPDWRGTDPDKAIEHVRTGEHPVPGPTRYQDYEVIGLDTDGRVLQWNARTQEAYNCGQTPEEYGLENFSNIELERIGRGQA